MSPRWGCSKYQRIVYYKDFAPKGALGANHYLFIEISQSVIPANEYQCFTEIKPGAFSHKTIIFYIIASDRDMLLYICVIN